MLIQCGYAHTCMLRKKEWYLGLLYNTFHLLARLNLCKLYIINITQGLIYFQLALLEAEKKVSMLLTLSGLTEGELKVFLCDSRRTTIIKQKLPPHLKTLHNKLRENLPPAMPGVPGEVLSSVMQLLR